jgi:hypothetical protein
LKGVEPFVGQLIGGFARKAFAPITVNVLCKINPAFHYLASIFRYQCAVTVDIGKIQLAFPTAAVISAAAVACLSSFHVLVLLHWILLQ